jgi:hypothetical protein
MSIVENFAISEGSISILPSKRSTTRAADLGGETLWLAAKGTA